MLIYYYSTKLKYKPNVDLNDLKKEIYKNKQLHNNIYGIDDYIDSCFRVLRQTYIDEKDIYYNFANLENYYTEIKFKNSELRIHFDISKAKQIAAKYNIQTIPLSAFSEYDDGSATIKYNPVMINKTHQLSTAPIITIPYRFSGLFYLTIDGNHRITKLKESNEYSVSAVLLALPDILTLISSNFEKAVYLFLYEGADIPKYIHNSATQYYKNGVFIF